MVQASQAFHNAVRDGKPQRALFLFDDYAFTNDDISLTDGVSYEEYFCGENDLTVGLCPSASLSFTILNYNDVLAGFAGGEFTAWLGAETATAEYQPGANENCRIEWNNAVYTGHSTQPYFRRNGSAFASQPGYPVRSIVLFRGFCYLIGENGQTTIHTVGTDISLSAVSDTSAYLAEEPRRILTANAFLLEKAKLLAKRGVGAVLNLDSRTLLEYRDGVKHTVEYVPMGVLYAERPARVRVKMVAIESYDRMRLFETEASGFVFSGTTLKELYVALAQYIGVPYDDSWTVNASLPVRNLMPDLKGMTAKELLGRIAEAACSQARFNRSGVLCMDWLTETGTSIDENRYSEYTPMEYAVAPVSKLLVRNSASDDDVIVGEGDNTYFIQENPFLSGNPITPDDEGEEDEGETEEEEDDTAEQTATAASAIYTRLAAVPSFSPATCSWFGDPAYRAGDVISVVSNGTASRFPVYRMSLKWTGTPKLSIGNSGGETREPPPERQRSEYRRNHTMNAGTIRQISRLNEGINSVVQRVSTIEGAQSTYETRISQTERGIELAAKQSDLNTLTGDVTDLQSQIRVTAAAITSKVSQTDFNALGDRVSTAESQIEQTAHDITLKVSESDFTGNTIVSKINLTSTTATIQANRVVLDALYAYFTGTSVASNMVITQAQIQDLYVPWNQGDSTSYLRYTPAQIGAVDASSGSMTSPFSETRTILIQTPNGTTTAPRLNLQHYHEIEASANSNGQVTITLGAVTSTAQNTNFNIADTAFYQNAVSAATQNGITAERALWRLESSSAFSNTPNLQLLFNSDLAINFVNNKWMVTSSASKYFKATDGTRTLYGTASVGADMTTRIQTIIDENSSSGGEPTISVTRQYTSGYPQIQKLDTGDYFFEYLNMFRITAQVGNGTPVTQDLRVSCGITNAIQPYLEEAASGSNFGELTNSITGIAVGTKVYESTGQYGVVYVPVTVTAYARNNMQHAQASNASDPHKVYVSGIYRDGYNLGYSEGVAAGSGSGGGDSGGGDSGGGESSGDISVDINLTARLNREDFGTSSSGTTYVSPSGVNWTNTAAYEIYESGASIASGTKSVIIPTSNINGNHIVRSVNVTKIERIQDSGGYQYYVTISFNGATRRAQVNNVVTS